MDQDYHYKVRITTLGDKSTGKTTFLESLTNTIGRKLEQESTEELSLKVFQLITDNRLHRKRFALQNPVLGDWQQT